MTISASFQLQPRASDSRIFLTFTAFIFLTLHFPKSMYSGYKSIFSKFYNKSTILNFKHEINPNINNTLSYSLLNQKIKI